MKKKNVKLIQVNESVNLIMKSHNDINGLHHTIHDTFLYENYSFIMNQCLMEKVYMTKLYLVRKEVIIITETK